MHNVKNLAVGRTVNKAQCVSDAIAGLAEEPRPILIRELGLGVVTTILIPVASFLAQGYLANLHHY
jgi:hypothetical protein